MTAVARVIFLPGDLSRRLRFAAALAMSVLAVPRLAEPIVVPAVVVILAVVAFRPMPSGIVARVRAGRAPPAR